MKSKVCKILLSFFGIILLMVLFKTGVVNAAKIEVISGTPDEMDILSEVKFKIDLDANKPTKWRKYAGISTMGSDNDNIATVEYDEANKVYIVSAKNIGKTTIKIKIRYKDSYGSSPSYGYQSLKLDVTIVDKAQQTLDDMKNAYKTIPSSDANANEIDNFIKSDAKYNKLGNLKTVSKETAAKWKQTIDDARVGVIERKVYTPSYDVLNDYINDKEIDGHVSILTNQMDGAIGATEETINERKALLANGNSIPRENITFTDVLKDIDSYVPGDTVTGSDAQKITEKASLILSVITNIGIVLAVLIPAILGIKYMLGSVEEKAEYKKDLLPYFIGSILLFGICTIVKVLQTLGESINNI